MAQWYYRVGGRDFGPVDDERLHTLLSDGALTATSEIRRDDSDVWRAVGTLPRTAGLRSHARSIDDADRDSLQEMLQAALPDVPDDRPTADHRAGAAPAAAGYEHWYYKSEGRELGPVSYPEIAQMAISGALSANDFVRPGASGAWQRAGRVSGLFHDQNSPTAASAPTPQPRQSSSADAAAEVYARPKITSEPALGEPPESPPTPKNRTKRTRPKSSTAERDAEDFAASLLAEEDESPVPMQRTVDSTTSTARTSDDIPSPKPRPSVPTPAPVSPRPTPTAAAAVTATLAEAAAATPAPGSIRQGPRRLSGGRSLSINPRMVIVAAAAIAIAAAGYFIPWNSFLGGGDKVSLAAYEHAVLSWGRIRVLHDNLSAKPDDWALLAKDLKPRIDQDLAALRPTVRKSSLAQEVYIFNHDFLLPILAQGKDAPEELFSNAMECMDEAKLNLPKRN